MSRRSLPRLPTGDSTLSIEPEHALHRSLGSGGLVLPEKPLLLRQFERGYE